MKTLTPIIIAFILAFSFCTESQAQIRNPFKKVQREAEKKANKEIDKGIEKAMDPEEAEKEKQQQEQQEQQQAREGVENDPQEQNEEDASPVLSWSKYDFVPGDEVFFEDDQAGEENGEFPSRWDIYSGNVENARLGEDNVVMFREDSYIMPFVENPESAYLPEVFTLEFDCYFHKGDNRQNYSILFHDKLNQSWNEIPDCNIYWNKLVMGRFNGWYPEVNTTVYSEINGWRHVSVSFNNRAMKVYLDDARILNIPNLKVKPTGISIWGEYDQYNKTFSYIKNVRLAKGGVKLYDRMLQDGKIVATGIRFDVGKATLKPESMGIINTIAEMMNEHPELNFSIEGHTDSDGDTDANQKLSEDRAIAVMEKLTGMGIEADRLSTKGFGESNPAGPNNTAEGKANNRRVEFVKI